MSLCKCHLPNDTFSDRPVRNCILPPPTHVPRLCLFSLALLTIQNDIPFAYLFWLFYFSIPTEEKLHESMSLESSTQQDNSKDSTVAVQWLSCVRLFVTPWTAAHQTPKSFTISQSLLTFMSIESVMPSNHLILCHPLRLWPSIFPSIMVFSNDLAFCIRWPEY